MDLPTSHFESSLKPNELPICTDKLHCRAAQLSNLIKGRPIICMVSVDAYYGKGLGLDSQISPLLARVSPTSNDKELTQALVLGLETSKKIDATTLKIVVDDNKHLIPGKDCPRFGSML